jgi:prepilin-type N-terminal cleavage/methylation domain-containing protein
MKRDRQRGFTLIELLVVTFVIGILASIVYANFANDRAAARDRVRMAQLEQMRLAIEAYKDKNGVYPDIGCKLGTFGYTTFGAKYFDHNTPSNPFDYRYVGPGPYNTAPINWGFSCEEYIAGLVPEFIDKLPRDMRDDEINLGYKYSVNTARDSYKLINWETVEVLTVSGYEHPLARCPYPCTSGGVTCGGLAPGGGTVQERAYAVYGGPQSACW